MVAVSHSPYSEKLIRATRRIAYNLEAPWVALHVDTGIQLSIEDQGQLVKNMNLARELKAEVITTTDFKVVDALRHASGGFCSVEGQLFFELGSLAGRLGLFRRLFAPGRLGCRGVFLPCQLGLAVLAAM